MRLIWAFAAVLHAAPDVASFLASLPVSRGEGGMIAEPYNRYAGSPLHSTPAAVESAAPSSSSAHLSPKRDFSGFDYGAHWYPVVWARDLRPNEPTRVTLFDVDYVVARTTAGGEEDESFYALVDECPHKKVALSEGRVTKGGDFQCRCVVIADSGSGIGAY